ncbi:MAG: DUF488 domain-containing protein [Deltaproteobacteria bacterium]|nr:DUF488 domain-containing protein [Deltaproteobacteria bacterium]
MSVFTIGHSTHALDSFVGLLRRHGVDELADVRSAPYSRFNPQFNRDSLANSLVPHGIEYVFLGRELGGRPDDPACYENGRVRYDRVAATPVFQRALERIIHDSAGRSVALLCAEKEPLECHRTLLVAQALEARGVTAHHIRADGTLENHAAAMDRLLVIHGDPPQGELFTQDGDRIQRAIARQTERMAARRRK